MITETLTMFGPGRNCDSESTSRNSASVSQRRSSTIIRRANGMTPPKPDTPTLRKPKNSSPRLRRATDDVAVESVIRSLAQQPEDEAQERRDDEPGRQREVEREAVALEAEIARQPAEAQLGEPRPREADDDQHDTERDE